MNSVRDWRVNMWVTISINSCHLITGPRLSTTTTLLARVLFPINISSPLFYVLWPVALLCAFVRLVSMDQLTVLSNLHAEHLMLDVLTWGRSCDRVTIECNLSIDHIFKSLKAFEDEYNNCVTCLKHSRVKSEYPKSQQ